LKRSDQRYRNESEGFPFESVYRIELYKLDFRFCGDKDPKVACHPKNPAKADKAINNHFKFI